MVSSTQAFVISMSHWKSDGTIGGNRPETHLIRRAQAALGKREFGEVVGDINSDGTCIAITSMWDNRCPYPRPRIPHGGRRSANLQFGGQDGYSVLEIVKPPRGHEH